MKKGTSNDIKQIPYGITDYELIREENYYYVDKTPFLKKISASSRYLFFIRPRRFGKSLFISLMEAYFDIYYKDRFDDFFKGTWIYDHPTDERGKYLVLSLNFSAVDPEPDRLEVSFLTNVQNEVVGFIEKYNQYLSSTPNLEYYSQKIRASHSATDILSTLLQLCKGAQVKLYIFIDEYDNFANTLLTSSGHDAYHDLTHGAGFFRSFFNVLKKGTTGTGAPITRTFITGVSPVTMDDVTSGYNIGEHVSGDAAFNRMLGFTEEDITQMLNYYSSAGWITHDTGLLKEIITQWYGNYTFSEHALDEPAMYNSDMVLFFLKEYFKIKSLPGNLIDRNVRIDYGKLRHLIIIDKGETKGTNGNFSQLKGIIETGSASAKIVDGFPLEKMVESENFKSLLFYFGLLTIKGREKDKLSLGIPNETVKRLFYDYIEAAYRETGTFDLNLSKYSELISDMAYDGKWEPLFQFITGRMQESMSLRDLITGEKSIQAFLNVYLGLSDLFIIHSEKELSKGFADIVMEPFLARYQGIKYSYILEIKYLKTATVPPKPDDNNVRHVIDQARKQLAAYSLDNKFQKSVGKTTLIKLVLVFSGHHAVYLGEAK